MPMMNLKEVIIQIHHSHYESFHREKNTVSSCTRAEYRANYSDVGVDNQFLFNILYLGLS